VPRGTAESFRGCRSTTCRRSSRLDHRGAAIRQRGPGSLRGNGPGRTRLVVLNSDILSGHGTLNRADRPCTSRPTPRGNAPPGRGGGPVPVRGWCRPTRTGRVTRLPGEDAGGPVTNRIKRRLPTCSAARVIDEIPAGRRVSVEREDVPRADRGPARWSWAITSRAYWLDVGGRPQAFVRGSCDLVLGRPAPARPVPGPHGPAPGAGRRDGGRTTRTWSGGTVVGRGRLGRWRRYRFRQGVLFDGGRPSARGAVVRDSIPRPRRPIVAPGAELHERGDRRRGLHRRRATSWLAVSGSGRVPGSKPTSVRFSSDV